MQEIAPHIYIETNYVGVTVGAIAWSHGLILVDAPFLVDDIRSYRSSLSSLGIASNMLLIILDAHYDRTLGTRAMDCTIIAHEKVAQVFRDRPISMKTQLENTGSEFEQHNGLGGTRWSAPEITYSQRMVIHSDDHPVVLEYHPGPAHGATWVILPEQKIVFIGDAVIPDAPPFLTYADIPVWIETLDLLLSSQYKNYNIISSRGGMINHRQVKDQLRYLKHIHKELEKIFSRNGMPEDTGKLLPGLLKDFKAPPDRHDQYQQRLTYGLYNYYAKHYRGNEPNNDEE
jgi:cyclase